jgi:hypothetical protein
MQASVFAGVCVVGGVVCALAIVGVAGGVQPEPPSDRPPKVPAQPLPPSTPLKRDRSGELLGEIVLVNVGVEKVGTARVLAGMGASPALCREGDGRVHAVYLREPERKGGEDGVAGVLELVLTTSGDSGQTWGLPGVVRIESAPGDLSAPAGPALVALPGGGLRLYFSAVRVVEGRPAGVAEVYSAVSRDGGKSFSYEPGVRLSLPEGASEVAVARMGEVWFMAVPRDGDVGGMTLATSPDGLAFSKVGPWSVRPGGALPGHRWRGSLLSADGKLTFIGGGALPGTAGSRQVWRGTSSDGREWTSGGVLEVEGFDVGAALLPGGEVLVAVTRRGGRGLPPGEPREPMPPVQPVPRRPGLEPGR